MNQNSLKIRKVVFSAVFIAIAMLLPLLTGQIPEVGNMLCPMHIPVLLCGFICGWPWGLAVGFISPLLRSAIFGMPKVFPMGIAMAFELATYGLVSGIMYKKLPKTTPYIYVTLISAMIIGRIVWGIVRFIIAGLTSSTFPLAAFISGAIGMAIPGIILHIILIPLIVMAMGRANLIVNE